MDRRAFCGASLGSAALTAAGCSEKSDTTAIEKTDTGLVLAGKTLAELRERYTYDLFDDYLPFLDKYVIDHTYGGFMCNTDRDGTNLNTDKRTWFEGRGIWVYSFLYNNVKPDPAYLDIATKSVEFIMKSEPAGNEFWCPVFTREGEPKSGPDVNFYSDMFVANGLQEYSKAVGDTKWWDKAREILLKCVDIYDNRPDYQNLPATDTAPAVKRPRIMGHWMVLLRCSTQMLEKQHDADIQALADRCIDAIMNHHHNPEHGLLCEFTNHDLSRIENDHGQIAIGHGPETLWMVMYEAIRRKDKALFDRAGEYMKYSSEVFWDDIYGGMLAGLSHIDKNIWNISKSLWLQEEILIGTLCTIEHTGAPWAKEWYSKEYEYVIDKFPLKQYGYPLWILYADRKVTFEEHYNRVGNFHHPRHLMLNILALDHLIERNGKPSGVFA